MSCLVHNCQHGKKKNTSFKLHTAEIKLTAPLGQRAWKHGSQHIDQHVVITYDKRQHVDQKKKKKIKKITKKVGQHLLT